MISILVYAAVGATVGLLILPGLGKLVRRSSSLRSASGLSQLAADRGDPPIGDTEPSLSSARAVMTVELVMVATLSMLLSWWAITSFGGQPGQAPTGRDGLLILVSGLGCGGIVAAGWLFAWTGARQVED